MLHLCHSERIINMLIELTKIAVYSANPDGTLISVSIGMISVSIGMMSVSIEMISVSII